MAESEPKENKTERVHILMSPSELRAVDDWGFANRIRTRGAALRTLAARGVAIDAADEAVEAARILISVLLNGETAEEAQNKWAQAYKKYLDERTDAYHARILPRADERPTNLKGKKP